MGRYGRDVSGSLEWAIMQPAMKRAAMQVGAMALVAARRLLGRCVLGHLSRPELGLLGLPALQQARSLAAGQPIFDTHPQ
eukprot:scaffold7835_cov45-Prasinocladus_malaysianus.AAC.1